MTLKEAQAKIAQLEQQLAALKEKRGLPVGTRVRVVCDGEIISPLDRDGDYEVEFHTELVESPIFLKSTEFEVIE